MIDVCYGFGMIDAHVDCYMYVSVCVSIQCNVEYVFNEIKT